MIGLLQRVSSASVTMDGEVIANIGRGLLVLIGVERGDTEAQAERLTERLLAYRVFEDAERRMNRSLRDIDGELLLVPQFTLAVDTEKGTRASFTAAAEPVRAQELFLDLFKRACERWPRTQSGRFGADMKVALLNDGPVTFWLQARPAA